MTIHLPCPKSGKYVYFKCCCWIVCYACHLLQALPHFLSWENIIKQLAQLLCYSFICAGGRSERILFLSSSRFLFIITVVDHLFSPGRLFYVSYTQENSFFFHHEDSYLKVSLKCTMCTGFSLSAGTKNPFFYLTPLFRDNTPFLNLSQDLFLLTHLQEGK